MSEILEPGGIARRLLLRPVLVASVIVLIAGGLGALAAAKLEIMVDNFTFAPTPLQVKAGTTVTWVNHDDIPHSIVLNSLNERSHPLDTNDSFAYKFDKAGTYNYICGLHPFMHGQVVVVEP
jgi:plastocyanin